MKKFILMSVVCLMAVISFSSCSEYKYLAKADFDVCFPDGTQTMERSEYIFSANPLHIEVASWGGTNYVYAVTSNFKGTYGEKVKGLTVMYSSTSPIRLINQDVQEIKKNKKDVVGRYDGER